MQDPVSGIYYRWDEHQLYKWDLLDGWVVASHSSMCTKVPGREVPEVPGGVDVNGAGPGGVNLEEVLCEEPDTKHHTPLLVEKQQEGLNGYAAKVALGGILAAGVWLTAKPALAMDIEVFRPIDGTPGASLDSETLGSDILTGSY